MQSKTVQKLNNLNKHFYTKVHKSFDQTRRFHWQGWEKMLNIITLKPKAKILDLGCGNGRFMAFLRKKLTDYEYLGLDNSKKLLEIAKRKYRDSNIKFKYADLLGDFTKEIKGKYDLICLFGVIHHIPGFRNRKMLLRRCKQVLSKEGIITVTLWQFINDPRYKDRLISSEQVGIDLNELEEGDYFLGWKDNKEAIRYCHYISDEELQSIINEQFTIKNSFLADGKSGKLNRYILLIPEPDRLVSQTLFLQFLNILII